MSRVAVDTSSISPEQLQTCYQLKRNVAHIVEVRLSAMERFPCDHPGPLKMLPLLQQHAHLKVFVASQGFHHNGSIEHTYVRQASHMLHMVPSLTSLFRFRYMRARKWDLHKATDMLTKTLNWRLDYKPYATRWADIGGCIHVPGFKLNYSSTSFSDKPCLQRLRRMGEASTFFSPSLTRVGDLLL